MNLNELIIPQVGCGGSFENGSCVVYTTNDFTCFIDLNKTREGESIITLIKKYARKKSNTYIIDLLFISHGDNDHIGDFEKLTEELENNKIIIGIICHQGIDRTKNENFTKEENPDYFAFQKEINKRVGKNSFGNCELTLSSLMTEQNLPSCISIPKEFSFTILSPFNPVKYDDDINIKSLIISFSIGKKNFLYCGDSTYKSWEDIKKNEKVMKIIKDTDYNYLFASHHGSANFFDESKQKVLEANSSKILANYDSLENINPGCIILCAEKYFPLKDKEGSNPPHYAAFKYYKHFYVQKGYCTESTKRPELIIATDNNDIKIDLKSEKQNGNKNRTITNNKGIPAGGFLDLQKLQ